VVERKPQRNRTRRRSRSLSVSEKAGLAFDVLSDTRQEVIAAYQVRFTVPADLKEPSPERLRKRSVRANCRRSWDLPIPAAFPTVDYSVQCRTG
jgi:hypothetical protein